MLNPKQKWVTDYFLNMNQHSTFPIEREVFPFQFFIILTHQTVKLFMNIFLPFKSTLIITNYQVVDFGDI